MTNTVEVLLSTFNGVKYLPQLLDSIWAQEYPDVQLTIRDDGSTDGTLALLRRSLSDRADVTVTAGANLGAGNSFLTLLRKASPSASYVAFCDQDDVWLPGKLSAAVSALAAFDGPTLYCSAVNLVGED